MQSRKTQTQTDKTMTDRYRCGPGKLKLNWNDKKMTYRYRCGPEKLKLKLTRQWLIDIGATLTRKLKLKLTWQWLIDIGAVLKTQTQTNKMITDRYRYGPNSNWTPIDRKMTDWYKCGPKNWTDKIMIWSSGSKPNDN